ncbi:MAG TPA: hypothetical protein VIK55_07850 [Paludibacter sp.]
MEISVLKSLELTIQDWKDLTKGFNESFGKDKKENELKHYYQNNPFGYSYHAVARNESGNIAGHTSVIPQTYISGKNEVLFGLSGGSYILKEYRKYDLLFKELYEAIHDHCKAEKMAVIVGIPNHNSFKFFTKILGAQYLNDLKYYLLPVKPFKILNKKKFTFIDPLVWLPVFILVRFNQLFAFLFSTKEKNYPVHQKLDNEFIRYRFNEKYQIYKSKQTNGTYRIYDEKGIKTAYIMDFRQNGLRTLLALTTVLKYILINEKVDAILYIGTLKMKQLALFEIPNKMIPQRFPLTYDLLNTENSELSQFLQSQENWDFGLMNFDVR